MRKTSIKTLLILYLRIETNPLYLMIDTTVLYQDNAITRARYDLSALELNIFFHVLKQIRFEKNSQYLYQINIKEVIDTEQKRATNHTALRKATKRLISKVIDIPTDKEGGFIQSALISSAAYQGGSGRILIQISEAIKPYLIDVAKNTTRYYFEIAVKLKSLYAKRFYVFCCQWKVAKTWRVSLQELRSRLQIEKQYKNYADFKIYVLNVAHEELMLHGDIFFTYEEIKQGRRVTDFIFTIRESSTFSRNQEKKIIHETQSETAADIFPLDNGKRLLQALKNLELSDWQIMNVLKTFQQQQGDLFAAIYQINSTPTIKNVGAKAWAVFTKKYNVPGTKMK